jgi:carboxylesterase type B
MNRPQVLARSNGADFEATLLQYSLPYDRDAVRMSDIDGLNLNICVPANVDAAKDGGLPVFVFIHGGGFHGGSSSFRSHDLARLVRLSVAKGMPTIAVSLNYRVGAPGFMHSEEMKEAGYLPNNGFRDQRTALLWLQNNVHGFSGNPDNVTLMGESAGAVSTAVHLHSKQPLFRRAMLMSGSTLLMGPAPLEFAEASYQQALSALDLESLTTKERLGKLVRMDPYHLRDALGKHGVVQQVSRPLVDGDLCPTSVDFKAVVEGSLELSGKKWCKSLLLGDCAFDVGKLTFLSHRPTD